ncbi:Pyruvate kinase [Frankliniella fusca]|uniref:Pyruvate kinase n=1 Tax=Frankliniella fusca TaxID=407009 RepID=A0AAE1GUR1_9NEOP|nr:Pyruvate kinase [Frankliniella fusca]
MRWLFVIKTEIAILNKPLHSSFIQIWWYIWHCKVLFAFITFTVPHKVSYFSTLMTSGLPIVSSHVSTISHSVT